MNKFIIYCLLVAVLGAGIFMYGLTVGSKDIAVTGLMIAIFLANGPYTIALIRNILKNREQKEG